MIHLATPELILASITYLLFKHAVADFMFQTGYMVAHKSRYGHPGGLVHAGLHVLLTLPLFLLFPGVGWQTIAAVAAIEFLLHYHQDFLKEQLNLRFKWVPERQAFWTAIGIDQLLHNLFYVGLVRYLTL